MKIRLFFGMAISVTISGAGHATAIQLSASASASGALTDNEFINTPNSSASITSVAGPASPYDVSGSAAAAANANDFTSTLGFYTELRPSCVDGSCGNWNSAGSASAQLFSSYHFSVAGATNSTPTMLGIVYDVSLSSIDIAGTQFYFYSEFSTGAQIAAASYGNTSALYGGVSNGLVNVGAMHYHAINYITLSGAEIDASLISDLGMGIVTSGQVGSIYSSVRFILPDGVTVSSDGGTPTNVISNVPESATWALFIGGFGAIGATMRRRKLATA